MLIPRIKLDRQLYFPGQSVTGSVTVSNKDTISLRSYRIKFIGTVVVYDDRHRGSHNTNVRQYIQAEEKYIDKRYFIWKSEDGKNKLPAGDHEWKFSFDLPPNCPSSYEDNLGFIRYSVKVDVDKPLCPKLRAEKGVSVCSVMDLNLIHGAGNIIQLMRLNGNVGFTIYSPTVCVSGQTIKLSGSLQNNSNKSIESIKASFCTSVTYRKDPNLKWLGAYRTPVTSKRYTTDRPVHEEKEREIELFRQTFPIPAGQTKQFAFPIDIPPVVGTINNCHFILVEYSIKLSVRFKSLFKSDAEASVEMLVGNVPLLAPGKSEAPPYTLQKGKKAQELCIHLDDFGPMFPYYGKENKIIKM